MKLPRLSKIILGLSFFILLSFLFTPPASAQGCSGENPELCKLWAVPKPSYEEILESSTTESHESFSARTFLYTIYPLNIGISGSDLKSAKKNGEMTKDRSDGRNYAPGAIHLAGGLVSKIITQPPSSSVEYIADLGSSIGLVKPAYAQGTTGYQGLSGVLETWKIFRNISYGLFVIVFVTVGFMIMFRSKLNPQTVVSLQLALPKLIITLLLITFSYAIAGFVIDLIYLLIYLAANLLDATVATYLSSSSFPELLKIFRPWDTADIISTSLTNLFPDGSVLDTTTEILSIELFSVSIFKLIIGGAILFSILKLLIQLVLAYVNIIIQVIFAPIILLFNALPAGNTFASWIRNLIANAAAFPAVAIMIMVGNLLVEAGSGSDPGTLQLPFIGFLAGGQSFVQTVVGFGLILLLPKIVTIIQEALKAKSALPVGAAVAEGAAAGTAPIRSYLGARKERKRMEQQAELYKQAQNT